MKNYKITVVNKTTGEIIEEKTELSNKKSFLVKKFEYKYRFYHVSCKVTIIRLVRNPGIQTNLIDMIKEMEENNG